MKKIPLILIVSLLFAPASPVCAEELGRFFLSKKQRQQLDYLRSIVPEEDTVVEKSEPEDAEEFEVVFEEEIEFEKEPLVKEPIQLKGVVYRGKKGNTAWLNEKNTYEGGLASINVTVKEDEISQDAVKMQLPDNVTEITLKVGETWQDANASSAEVDDN